jgi:aldose 1-epimerase
MSITQGTWQGVPAYILDNEQFSITLLPTIGSNVIRMWDKSAQREVLRVPESLDAILEQPGHFGIPMMMPPNRIRHGKFDYEGRHYQLAINTPVGHHIHGILRSRPWQIAKTEENSTGVSITTSFHSTDFPELDEQYPHDLLIEVTYTLTADGLYQEVSATNNSDVPAPYGFGLHTWFMIDGEPDKWTFKLPVDSIWELDNDAMPTEKLLPLGAYSELAAGITLDGENLDTIFQIGSNPVEAVLSKDGYSITYSASDDFKQWVIFTRGLAHNYICIEPYTWVTNAPNLQMDPEVTGFSSLAPGETRSLWIDLKIT